MMTPTDIRLTPAQAANYLGIKEQTLAVWRCTKRYDLPYVRVGRCVRYNRSDLDAFIEQRRVTCTAEAAD